MAIWKRNGKRRARRAKHHHFSASRSNAERQIMNSNDVQIIQEIISYET